MRKQNDGMEGEQVCFTLESVIIAKMTTAPRPPRRSSSRSTRLPRHPKAKKPLSSVCRIALEALSKAILELGKVPPPSNTIPPAIRTVTIEQWRSYAYKRGISTGGDRARQQAFQRAVQTLAATKRVGIWEELVWLPR